MEYVTLSNGLRLPRVGMGLWAVREDEGVQSMLWAVEAGYRLFDTAMYYHNDEVLRRGVAACGLPREELLITSKIWPNDMVHGRLEGAFERHLEALGLDYLDLLLLHWPIGDVAESWKTLEKLYRQGRVRAIGVSNFLPRHLDLLAQTAEIPPMVNQLESRPYHIQQAAVDESLHRGIAVEAWGPLGKGMELSDPVLVALGEKYGRSPAQIILRWHIQRGLIVIPKSSHRERLAQNLALFDFALSDADCASIAALDRDESQRFYPFEYDREGFGQVPEDGLRPRP